MKKLSSRLLLIAFFVSLLFQLKAQNNPKSADSKDSPRLHKGLAEMADLYQAKIAINEKNMDGYTNYSFREANKEVKVQITSKGNISELHKALKSVAGVKIISLQSDVITCWVEIAQLRSFANGVNEIVIVRPFSTNPEVFSQEIRKKPMTRNADGSTNFPTKDDESEEKEKKEKEDATWWSKERDMYEFGMLVDPATGTIPPQAATVAANAALKAKPFKTAPYAQLTPTELTVVPRGPNNLGGRTRALGIDKRNAQIMLAGGVSSGMFRSNNGGTSWTRVAPIGRFHNVTSLAQDTRAGFEDTWYYGTGEAVGNSATLGSTYFGNGIWKSTDNGLTWAPLAATVTTLETFSSGFDFVHRITVDPTNGNVYAATGNVISRSTDGGATWATVLGTLANSRYTDVIVTPTGRLYASFDGRDNNEGVWTSTTGASGSWTKIAGTISAVRTPSSWNAFNTYGRIVMAYAPSNPDAVFFLYWNGTTSSCAGTPAPEARFYKYVQSTGTFTDLSANLPDEPGCSDGNDPFAVQTGYDLLVTVKPDDENTVFIGGTNLYRSTSGFTNTTATTRIGGYNSPANYALYPNHHPDQHIAIYATGDNNTLYTGNDGGVQKADASAATVAWTSLNNNYVTYQYYNVDIDPANGSTALMGGAQDNGTTTVQAGSNFSSVFGGDGCGTAIISYTSPTSFNALASSQRGNIVRLTGPSAGFSIRPAGSAAGAFVTNFNLDQDNTNYLYFAAGAVVYRTRIARTITGGAVSGSATGWEIVPAGISGNIQSWGASRNVGYEGAAYTASNPNRKLYIGTTTGRVYRLNDPAFTTSAAVEITPVAPIAASGVCSSIAVNPFDDNEIMVTYSNYAVRSVYHTLNANDAAPTWTVIEGPATGPVTLGSARASAITRIGATKTYLVGNSTGLYSTQALSGATTVWERVGTNEINYALAANMRLRTSDNRIVLGTHGNGMFELQLAAAVNISSQPVAVTACAGSDVSFSVAAVGITNYKWQVSPDSNPANFTDLTIAAPYSTTNSGATLNIAAITNGLNGVYYRCVLTDAFSGITNSNSALLTVANPVDPTSVMVNNANICVGGNVSLTATCSVGTVTWYNLATGGTAIGTGSPLSQNPTVDNTTYYASCKAGACESNRIATSPVTITTIVSPTGVAASVSELCSGSSVSLTATCSDAGAVVNWYTQAIGGVAVGTGSPLSQSPTVNTTYYASCKGTSCESGRVATPLVTIVPNLNAPTSATQVNLRGTLTTSDPIYNRPLMFTLGSGTCALSTGGNVFNYKAQTFTLSAASTVVASLLTADGGAVTPGSADTFLTLYSDFDPANPCANIVGINDDFSSTVFISKITTTASLPAGTYTAVLTSFDPGTAALLPWNYSIAVRTTASVLVVGSPPAVVKVNGVTTPVTTNNGVSVALSAACNDGAVTWYDAMTGGTALGTGSPFNAFPMTSRSYFASCKNSCSETARVTTQMITVTQNTFVDITKAAAPTQNGASWATAYGNLQTALAASTAGGSIWVAQGTYKTTATTTRTIYFNIPSDVKVYGGFAGTETMLSQRNPRTNVTILSGEIGSASTITDNSHHVVNLDGSGVNTLLDGFTVMGGNANFDPSKTVSASSVPASTTTIETGGGIVIQNAGMPTIINCMIVNNGAVTGGGIFAGDGSMPKIIACKIMANQATFGSGIYFQDGSNGSVNNTLLSGNRGVGTVYNNTSNPMIMNCTIAANGGYNGGIFNTSSQPMVTNSIIWGNATPFNDLQSIIRNSNVQGGYAGAGNINFDPKFVNQQPDGISPTMNGDYHVQATSLTIDRGDNGTISLTDMDLDGNLRRFFGGTVDMGAFEFQGAGVPTEVISAQTGNWESNTTWVGMQVPKLGDKVIINANHTVTINSEVIAKDVEYRGTGTIKFNSATAKLNTGN
ncbi:MAG: right-handed parallel beta-helix repeat-containing protein [Arcicella sp.]|nr:right-handed parallel beta-helix repeat-containing protein [Arcicella sp.]